MLGVVLGLIDLVKPKSVMKILETQIPRTFLEINRKALHLGMKLAAGNQN
jgi:2-oxoglutarate ferredoxin oxidoreductase subunit gamma